MGVSPTLEPLKDGGDIIVTNNLEKANLLNSFFISQTILDDKNALLPDVVTYVYECCILQLSIQKIDNIWIIFFRYYKGPHLYLKISYLLYWNTKIRKVNFRSTS